MERATPQTLVEIGKDRAGFRAHRRSSCRPATVESESAEISSHCRIQLAQGNQLRNRDDTPTSTVGGHDAIFIRDSNNQVRVLNGHCRFRHTPVCREARRPWRQTTIH